MELMTKEHRAQLLANGQAMAEADISNTVQPVVKLFMPDGAATWLLAWLEPYGIHTSFFGWQFQAYLIQCIELAFKDWTYELQFWRFWRPAS